MDRKKVWVVLLITLFINLSATVSANSSDPSLLFEKTLSVNPWHFHLSHHRFPADGGDHAILKLTQLGSVHDIKDGLITLNGRFIHLRPFFSSTEKISSMPVTLTAENRLVVFLWGTPGAGIKLELLRNGQPELPPVIVLFKAEPTTIQRGQSSLLQWQTEHAERCEIQPGIGIVATTGSLQVSPTETVHYTLTAWGQKDPATSSVTILIENSGPAAEPQHVGTTEDTPVSILLKGYDVDGDALTFQIESGPTHGELIGQPPDLVYRPDANYAGTDSFSFTVGDGRASSLAAVVTIAVQALNDAPMAHAGQDQTVFVGYVVTLDGSLSEDLEGEALTYWWTLTSTPSGSLASLNHPGSVQTSFTPDKPGEYQVQLTVHDGTKESEPAIVRITANPKMVTVPNVAGLALADATLAITSAKLSLGPISESHHESLAAGKVISQTPAAGAATEEGTPVSLVVSLGPVRPLPVAAFQAVPAAIAKGSSTVLTWETAHAKKVHIDGGIGATATSGSVQVSPAHSTTYTLTAVGDYGTVSATAFVQVSVSPAPQPAGSFGKQYEDLIPPDAAIEQHNPTRFAVITGGVENAEGQPVESVSVAVHGHPEYGTARTDAQGRFNLPVEGGGTLTLLYRKAGLISAHRQVYVPWNSIAVAESIQMLSEDSAATTVRFDGSSGKVTVHRSTPVEDSFGQRSCTVVFAGDNKAYLTDPGGNQVLELPAINVRATEYRTPQTMPAKLPPNSAYTYCVELSVDGAERVRFAKPVVMWVENFLGFAVGGVVPVGYYDRDRGVWVPSENGRVVRLLDRDGNGVVDALDANDDGQPEDLNGSGFYEDEVAGLDDPRLYAPGATFWRVAVGHFTPWDCNWPYGPPSDAGPPNAAGIPDLDQQQTAEKTCSVQVSSFVDERSRIFHEDIPLPGTGMSLHYASNRVPGYRHLITVPASGPEVPQSLKQILVKLEIAGRTFETVLEPLPNQKAEFHWDGRDHLGGELSGSVSAEASIGFVYPAVYLNPGNFSRAFAQAGGSVTGIRSRQEVTSWKRHKLVIRSLGSIGTFAEGWTLSSHHQMNLSDLNTIHRGDGFLAQSSSRVLSTVAGTGTPGFSGDGGPATAAMLNWPFLVTVHPSGDLYFADVKNKRIRKIDPEGIITTAAGGGSFCRGDGFPAVEDCLSSPQKAAFDVFGNMYIADSLAGRIRKVDTNGIITTAASGINHPSSVAVDSSGNIYCTEQYINRVQKIDPSGVKTTLVSGGFANITDLALDRAGNLYITDRYGCRVVKMDTAGRMTTVAGTGVCGYSGDGGPATQARLGELYQIDIDRAGNLYIGDFSNGSVRKVDSRGIITTVAGNGTFAAGVDGKPATQTSLYGAFGVAVGLDGSLYVTEPDAPRIRQISQPAGWISSPLSGDIPFAEENGVGHIFSSAGWHLKTVDLETGRDLYTFDNDEDGRVVSVSDRFGNLTAIERDSAGRPFAVLSPDGLRTTFALSGQGHLTRIVYPDGSAYRFEYTAEGLLTAKVDPNGNRFEHLFDGHGRLESAFDEEQGYWQFGQSVDAGGAVNSTTLTAEGDLTRYRDLTESTGAYTSRITDATGAETVFSSSADGLAARKSLSCGMVLDFIYGADARYKFRALSKLVETAPSNLKRTVLFDKTYQDTDGDRVPDRITQTVTLNGKTTSRLNDILQANTVITTPQGRRTTTAYDPQNLLVSRVSTLGLYDSQFSYDPRGRLTRLSSGTRQTAFAYNAIGKLAAITDPLGRQSFYEYDAVGRVSGITRSDGSFVDFTYDANGNMTALVNPAGVSHRFGYNKVHHRSSYTAPLSGSYQYRFDRDRRPTETVFPSGRIIRNVYDRGQLVRTETPEGGIYLNYLCGVKVGSITKGGEGIAYGYDGRLLTSETFSGTLNQLATYSYDNDFELVQATYAGESTGYGYDNDGLLTQAGVFSIARDAGSGLAMEVSGGPLRLSRSFNGYGEIDSQALAVGGRAVSSFSLLRDNAGSIVRKSEAAGGAAATYEYGYDAGGRLLRVFKDGVIVEEYQYDESGARIYEVNTRRGITGRSYAYTDEDHLLAAGEWTYQYDLDGFLTHKTSSTNPTNKTQYFYSSRGELLAVLLPDGKRIEYVCDPLGRRIAKLVNGAVVEKYLWQGLTRLLAVYNGFNSLLMRFEYADERMPVAMTAGGLRYYLAYDQVGSLIAVADGSGSVVKRISYDSFGNILEDSNPGFAVPFGFAGGLHDRDTGLVRFGYRDYDPEVGRWTAKDPIGFGGGDTDLYGYVLNDPVNYMDSVGLWKKSGHSQLTIDAMIASNSFTEAEILRAVNANLLVDRLTNQFNDAAHFMPGNRAAAERLISSLLMEAIAKDNAGLHNEAMDLLGQGLHTIQDRYAHYEQNAGWSKHIGGAACDDPVKRASEFSRARMSSIDYINQFLRGTDRR
jgi:RHS repeat-associated protein